MRGPYRTAIKKTRYRNYIIAAHLSIILLLRNTVGIGRRSDNGAFEIKYRMQTAVQCRVVIDYKL